jgi:predicted nucleic acid-binding Zn ribbon protein
MPTYVYRFLDAEGTIEVQQAFSDPPLTEAVHPDDGLLHPVKKVFTPVGITFKGNGFYKTDSRSSGSAGKAAKAEPSSSSSDSAGTSPASTSPTTTAPAAASSSAAPSSPASSAAG